MNRQTLLFLRIIVNILSALIAGLSALCVFAFFQTVFDAGRESIRPLDLPFSYASTTAVEVSFRAPASKDYVVAVVFTKNLHDRRIDEFDPGPKVLSKGGSALPPITWSVVGSSGVEAKRPSWNGVTRLEDSVSFPLGRFTAMRGNRYRLIAKSVQPLPDMNVFSPRIVLSISFQDRWGNMVGVFWFYVYSMVLFFVFYVLTRASKGLR